MKSTNKRVKNIHPKPAISDKNQNATATVCKRRSNGMNSGANFTPKNSGISSVKLLVSGPEIK